jgi:hypothetical protein
MSTPGHGTFCLTQPRPAGQQSSQRPFNTPLPSQVLLLNAVSRTTTASVPSSASDPPLPPALLLPNVHPCTCSSGALRANMAPPLSVARLPESLQLCSLTTEEPTAERAPPLDSLSNDAP